MATVAAPRKTVGDVVFENAEWFNKYMATPSNLKKVVSVMIERKVINKKLGKYCITTSDSELLLGDMKNLTLEKFIRYLEILMEFGSLEHYNGETRVLMRFMRQSLEAMEPEPNSKHAAVISKFISVAFHQRTSESDRLSESLTKESVSDPGHSTKSIQPLPGQFENTVSCSFTKKGGVLYSPVHGVTVTIPPRSIPRDFERFDLSMQLDQQFTVEDDVHLCSVVVWFQLSPYFEFLEDVTVEIPHAARADSASLCVLTWGEDKTGPPYKLDTEVPADFSDGYHAVFKRKHFSPYGVGKRSAKMTRKRAMSMKYVLMCCMPSDRSGIQWDVTFASVADNPTENQLANKCWEKWYGPVCDVKQTRIYSCSDCLELSPQEWSNNSWNVFAMETPVLSLLDTKAHTIHGTQLLSVTYTVQCSDQPPPTALRCRIEVSGAEALNGKTPFFVLTSSPAPARKPQAEQFLCISSYLYGDSEVIRAVNNAVDDIILTLDSPDHIKFLAEISFQLSNPTIFCHALQLPQSVLDQVMLQCQHIGDVCFPSYKLLTEWVIRSDGEAKMSKLMSKLHEMGFKMKLHEESTDILLSSIFDETPFPNICSSEYVLAVNDEVKFVLNLSRMLPSCWRRVGSLMGIPLVQLDEINEAASADICSTPGYSMLLEWQRRNGREATLGTVFKALKCVFHHKPSHINHAYWYASQKASESINVST